jgi:hypothetical protein
VGASKVYKVNSRSARDIFHDAVGVLGEVNVRIMPTERNSSESFDIDIAFTTTFPPPQGQKAAQAYSSPAGSHGSEHQAPTRVSLRAKASPLQYNGLNQPGAEN